MAIVDYNRLQGFGHIEEVLTMQPLSNKCRAFNWSVREIEGLACALAKVSETLPHSISRHELGNHR